MDPRIAGISKPCCPACTLLLEYLFLDNPQPMHTCGSHHTIYPCSLPPWLPIEIIEKMVTTFGDILKRMLRKLAIPEGDQRRSGDSNAASIYSADSHVEDGAANTSRAIWARKPAAQWTNEDVTTVIDPCSEPTPGLSPHSEADLRQSSHQTTRVHNIRTMFFGWATTILAARMFKNARNP